MVPRGVAARAVFDKFAERDAGNLGDTGALTESGVPGDRLAGRGPGAGAAAAAAPAPDSVLAGQDRFRRSVFQPVLLGDLGVGYPARADVEALTQVAVLINRPLPA